jgi:hypothetical protein
MALNFPSQVEVKSKVKRYGGFNTGLQGAPIDALLVISKFMLTDVPVMGRNCAQRIPLKLAPNVGCRQMSLV